jgi:hypothetical protein
LNRDQKPSEQDEMKRILQYNGRISKYFDEEIEVLLDLKEFG